MHHEVIKQFTESVIGQQWLVLGDISIRRYQFVIDGTGQYIAILVGAWWYWVSIEWYSVIIDSTLKSVGGLYAIILREKKEIQSDGTFPSQT